MMFLNECGMTRIMLLKPQTPPWINLWSLKRYKLHPLSKPVVDSHWSLFTTTPLVSVYIHFILASDALLPLFGFSNFSSIYIETAFALPLVKEARYQRVLDETPTIICLCLSRFTPGHSNPRHRDSNYPSNAGCISKLRQGFNYFKHNPLRSGSRLVQTLLTSFGISG